MNLVQSLGGAAVAAALLVLSPAAPARAQGGAPAPPPGGGYRVDPAHASINFRIEHIGLSHYTARFTRFEVRLQFDPQHPETSSVLADIDARSLQTNYPEPQKLDFDAQIEKEFLAADRYPRITFRSTRVERTGPATARVTGDFTLHGVTRPVTLEATYNGGFAAGPPMGTRLGFSAHGVLRRSDFGITYGLPPAGTKFGVGDEIDVAIEAEFTPGS